MVQNIVGLNQLDKKVKELIDGGDCQSSCIYLDRQVPSNIPFEETIYMKNGKQLMAIKILMASYVNSVKDKSKFQNGDNGYWFYLVQTPYGIAWRNDLTDRGVRFFSSKEEYFQHLENGCGGFSIEEDYLGKLINATHLGSVTLKKTWRWNGHCAEQTSSVINNIVLNKDGVNFIYKPYSGQFWTKEECIKANIGGLEIVEFPPIENTIKVDIQVVKSAPIIRTINIIED